LIKNLIDIKRLTRNTILEIIRDAEDFENGLKKSDVTGKTVCMMFFENSTRTHFSFELAAKKLGMNVLNFDARTSSFSKGESMKDTFENLYFIGVDACVIRHCENGIVEKIMNETAYPMHFINGGDGNNAHPTQALLDFYTMKKKIGSVEGKKVVIIGDIAHSRVAKSNLEILNKFGANVHFCAPDYFTPANYKDFNAVWHTDLKEAVLDADVVMLLRVQNERLDENTSKKARHYTDLYKLNSTTLEEYAPNAILMHPGPVNREVEITSELLDSEKGVTILEQARNGVFIRMAVLNMALGGKSD
jgi:aspartate carbamoyltransferase catalytic subunit